jgi:class 3 adenylate cyclase/HAMP domain-containing protein|uniref:HAMP domain-containing protein n=1 Tax=Desulfobacca acetoxidans TaxID=60893 RepID=A0A7V6A2Y2_9BACT
MSIRTSLVLSYLALVVLLTGGMLAGADWVGKQLRQHDVAFAKDGVEKITTANLQISETVLRKHGEFLVEDTAGDIARELTYILPAGKKSYNYAELRRNAKVRRIAVQNIMTPDGVAGYTDLLDIHGMAILHPNPQVEGKNFNQWKQDFPEMWNLVERSFSQPQVSGYYRFLDRENRRRQKFMALVRVPDTPFVVVAAVNIDEYFLPAHEQIKNAAEQVKRKADRAISQFAAAMDRKAKIAGLSIGTMVALIGLLFGIFFASTISRPLRWLQRGARELGAGNFAVAVPAKGAREVVELAHSFNDLGQQLTDYIAKRDFIRDTFGRYVTREVVQRLLESEDALALGGETREVTILMSDLRGFTALTADMTPEGIIALLNRYLEKMIAILVDYRAVIDEIQGDGILAFFGAPEALPDHPAQAVACAVAMQAAMDEINAINAAEGLPHLEMGIGVSSGAVVVGNIGSELRTKYSVVGSPVNFTSRIEGLATAGQVLIGADTFQKVKDLVETGEVLNVRMKGIPGAVTLYEVRGIGAPFNLKLKERREALVALPEHMPVHLDRIRDKVVVATLAKAWLTHLSETSALTRFEGELAEWEDVRLHLLDADGQKLPGRIYGKVTTLAPGTDGLRQATIRFTSVGPEIHQKINEIIGQA